jgi:hypothetical protein
LELLPTQQALASGAFDGAIFLEGPAGTGKTTAGAARLEALLKSEISAASILIWVPQRTLALPYYAVLDDPERPPGGQVNVITLGGLARRAVDLFWPLVAAEHGFQQPERRPTFLTLETAQYYMARVIGPVIEREGYFETVAIDRGRLYSQIIDNLNKAATIGFPYGEIGERLKAAWDGDEVQLRMYDEVQDCANRFREYCLAHNLLDFSLQVEIFMQHLLELPQCRRYFLEGYRHLIADNIEEDTPAAHFVLGDLLNSMESALLIYDLDAGYRRFLGADPATAYALKQACQQHTTFSESLTASPELDAFGAEIARSLNQPAPPAEIDPRPALAYDTYRYHPEMLDGVADEIAGLVEGQGVPPGEIVVIAPFLSDALRFSLTNRLQAAGIPVRSHRPSRALREEPAAQCLLTLAQIAHPDWGLRPTVFDVVYALMESIDELDLVRAQLLAREAFHLVDRQPRLAPFERVRPAVQERVTFLLGERYDRLQSWLDEYCAGEPLALDHFFSRLFGEVLSQVGFGFHSDFDAAGAAANLVDSARKFRWIIEQSDTRLEDKSPAQEYVEMVMQGIIADQYLRGWEIPPEEAVLLAPAYTFLMSNRPVDYQYWLNVGGHGWAERLYQPLTNPYVLSQGWPQGQKWTGDDEYRVAQDALYRLALGLARRCRREIYLGFSELGEQGYEQRGQLLQAVQQMLRRFAAG